ncbi:MAG TPA: nuclear transport factor 2 family protein [Niastella sp.]|nr:nuclear transport factor 2 family protein [Niastella sp.]
MSSDLVLQQLHQAFNQRNINLFMECFADDYRSEQPLHPDRAFAGKEQVRINWDANFKEMPDFTVELLSKQTGNDTIWAEWNWKGTRIDGSKLHMRGVTLFGAVGQKIIWARLYMELVAADGAGIEVAVKEVMQGKKA